VVIYLAKKKYKKLTNKEKQLRKEVREELREKGMLPPIKPRLNRNKFSKEVQEEFENSFERYTDIYYLYRAIGIMLPVKAETDIKVKISSEQIGVLKVLKMAMEIKKFEKEIAEMGEKEYSLMDMYEKVIAPVLNL
jgi:hypothetical protein